MILLAVFVVLLLLLGLWLLKASVRDADFKMAVAGFLCWGLAAILGYPTIIWIIESL